jgi:hypothetical protein
MVVLILGARSIATTSRSEDVISPAEITTMKSTIGMRKSNGGELGGALVAL